MAMTKDDGKSASDRHTLIQTVVLRSKHQELREKLNFHSIYPHLNSHGLLPPSLDQMELVDRSLITLSRQIDMVITYMPNCGKPNFLDEFIICLKKTIHDAGDAHMELAQSLEVAYKSEMELKFVSPEREEIATLEATISHLKEEISRVELRIGDLKSKNENLIASAAVKQEEAELRAQHEKLKKQLSIKQQNIQDLKTKIMELKEEVKEKPVALLPLKKPIFSFPLKTMAELKEKAVAQIKDADTAAASAQLTTATWNLRGVEVCGEMTVVVYSSHDQQITWEGFGLRLNIPKGCLPAGMEQCTINIKASLAGQYEFPKNTHPVSAVIWLRCEDVHKFTRPITVEIQHCAKSENLSNLTIVRAVCSQKQLPYTFKQLRGGNFSCHSCYGVIELNSFSGLAAVQARSDIRRYYSKIFFLNNYFGGHRIDLIITWDTEAHLTVVKRHYRKQRGLEGPDQPIEFEGKEIRLDLPMEETKINGTWTIVPLIDPMVTKSEVDSYLPGMRIPHCELAAHSVGELVTRLVLQISLLGAKPPRNKFTLSYMPPTASAVIGSPRGSPAISSPSESIKPKLKDLQKELYSTVANEWEDIGIQLDIEEGQLKQIKSDNVGDSKACLREMLRVWLSRIAPPPSWSAMADALDTLGHQDIATRLRIAYNS